VKGQFNVEYLTAFGIFALVMLYSYTSISNFIPAYLQRVEEQKVKADAFYLSEVLLNDPGEPPNWLDPQLASRIGLLDEKSMLTNVLSLEKVKSFCSKGVEVVKQKTGMDEDFVVILIDKDPGNVFGTITCGSDPANYRLMASVSRNFMYLNQTHRGYGEMVVKVWKL